MLGQYIQDLLRPTITLCQHFAKEFSNVLMPDFIPGPTADNV